MGKYCTAGQATVDKMEHAHCMLDDYGYKRILTICNSYSFSTVTMVAGRRLSVTLCVHCLSCLTVSDDTLQEEMDSMLWGN